MKVVSIINYKGGVGKTTVTTNLAAALAKQGKRVLVIDLDPQTNLTFSFINVDEWRSHFEKNYTIKTWFDGIIDTRSAKSIKLQDLIIKAGALDIISSHLGLIDIDLELAVGLAGASPTQIKKNFIKTYSYLKDELDTLKDSYDIVLFDCPPNFSIVTKNAIVSSDYYVVPAKMDYLSTLGINQLRNRVNELVKEYNSFASSVEAEDINPEFLGVIATMISIRSGFPIKAHQGYIQELMNNNIDVFNSKIRENKTLYAESPEYGVPVVLQRYGSGTYGEVVDELKELTNEFISKVGL